MVPLRTTNAQVHEVVTTDAGLVENFLEALLVNAIRDVAKHYLERRSATV
jgi:hypothetical protein